MEKNNKKMLRDVENHFLHLKDKENLLFEKFLETEEELRKRNSVISDMKRENIDMSSKIANLRLELDLIRRKYEARFENIKRELANNLVGASKQKREMLKYQAQMATTELDTFKLTEFGDCREKISNTEIVFCNNTTAIDEEERDIKELKLTIMICCYNLKGIYKDLMANPDNLFLCKLNLEQVIRKMGIISEEVR